MTRVERGKYTALIRGDYLNLLGTDKDVGINSAIKEFPDLPFEKRREAVENQRARITFAAAARRDYEMWLDIFNVDDDFVSKLEQSYRYDSLDRILNAAIKVWLRKQGKNVKD